MFIHMQLYLYTYIYIYLYIYIYIFVYMNMLCMFGIWAVPFEPESITALPCHVARKKRFG